ncbi:MAG: hypothetical protein JXB32_21510, partial [Deltaproteobacteria bacterium]|nr:hypothetical protein [Deltaproteobacteria bacterium]
PTPPKPTPPTPTAPEPELEREPQAAPAPPEPGEHLPSLEDLEAALEEAAAPAAPDANGFDISVDQAPRRPETPSAAGTESGSAAESPRPAGTGAIPMTYEEALRQALAEEQAPDDAYDGVWVPTESVASDSEQEIIERLTQAHEPAESSCPDMRFAAEGRLDAPDGKRKGGLLRRLFGRKKE